MSPLAVPGWKVPYEPPQGPLNGGIAPAGPSPLLRLTNAQNGLSRGMKEKEERPETYPDARISTLANDGQGRVRVRGFPFVYGVRPACPQTRRTPLSE